MNKAYFAFLLTLVSSKYSIDVPGNIGAKPPRMESYDVPVDIDAPVDLDEALPLRSCPACIEIADHVFKSTLSRSQIDHSSESALMEIFESVCEQFDYFAAHQNDDGVVSYYKHETAHLNANGRKLKQFCNTLLEEKEEHLLEGLRRLDATSFQDKKKIVSQFHMFCVETKMCSDEKQLVKMINAKMQKEGSPKQNVKIPSKVKGKKKKNNKNNVKNKKKKQQNNEEEHKKKKNNHKKKKKKKKKKMKKGL